MSEVSTVSNPFNNENETECVEEPYELEGITVEDIRSGSIVALPQEFDQRTVMSQGQQSVNVNVNQGGDGDDWYKLAEFALVNARRLGIFTLVSGSLMGFSYLGFNGATVIYNYLT